MSTPLLKSHELASAWRRRVCRVRMSAAAVKVAWALVFGLEHGISYASQDRLADETGVDRGDIGKLLREMAKVGLIEAVEPQVLVAALAADGQPRADRRLVGYRRVIGPDVILADHLACLVSVGTAITTATSLRINKRRAKAFGVQFEGDGAPDRPDEVINPGEQFSLCIEGDGASKFEGDGASPYRSPDSFEADAERVRNSLTVVVEISEEAFPIDLHSVKASAPEGARQLHGRLESELEDAFGRSLHDHERERIIDLVGQIGRPAVHARVSAYVEALQSGATSPLSVARWLRQGGLVGISNVA